LFPLTVDAQNAELAAIASELGMTHPAPESARACCRMQRMRLVSLLPGTVVTTLRQRAADQEAELARLSAELKAALAYALVCTTPLAVSSHGATGQPTHRL
jgi:hypothetical protein